MANYVTLDMDLTSICSSVLQEYKTPVTGSNAMALDYIEDMVNVVYFDIFNRPELHSYRKEIEYTFPTKDYQQVGSGGVLASAVTLLLDDSANWPTSGTAWIDNKDVFVFTGNTTASDTLTGVSGIAVDHDEGVEVQLGYTLPTDIDEQKIISVKVGGLNYNFVEASLYFDTNRARYREYTIFDQKLYVSNSDAETGLIFYESVLSAMTSGSDKPVFVPGKYRYDLLVSGTIARVGVRDDMRTGWDWHQNNYETKLKMFIASMNNPVVGTHPCIRPSIYD